MKYWVVINKEQRGPFTLEELRQQPVDAQTPVWCTGMTDWQPLSTIPELAPLLRRPEVPSPGAQAAVPGVLVVPAGEIPPGYVAVVRDPASTAKGVPTYMVLSIVLTFFALMIVGLIAIFFSWRVRVNRRAGNMAKAYRASERAALINILNIVLTLIYIPFSGVLSLVDFSIF